MLTTQQKHSKRVQAAFYSNENPEKTTKQIARKFAISDKDVKSAISKHKKGTLLKKGSKWDETWDQPDVIFHVNDSYVDSDISNGGKRDSTLIHGMFEPNYDAVNGGLHYQWNTDDVTILLNSLPYRVLEILRDSEPGSEDYEEAVLMMDSPIFKAICKKVGLEHDEVLINALLITKADI